VLLLTVRKIAFLRLVAQLEIKDNAKLCNSVWGLESRVITEIYRILILIFRSLFFSFILGKLGFSKFNINKVSLVLFLCTVSPFQGHIRGYKVTTTATPRTAPIKIFFSILTTNLAILESALLCLSPSKLSRH